MTPYDDRIIEMTPKTEIQYNYDFGKRLHIGDRDFEQAWQDVVNWGGNFEEIYELYIDQILAIIPKLTGYPWEENADEFIPIYIVGDGDPLSRPLTLPAQADTSAMLVQLIAQLIRQNLHFGFKVPGDRASAINQVMMAVTSLLDVDLKDAVQDAAQWDIEKYGDTFRPRSWDLSKATARQLLEQGT